jgi:CIC family chloride channel protein
MLATGLATVIADRLHPESIYTLPLRRDGIAYAEPEDVDIMETVLVGEVMVRDPMTVTVSTPVEVLRETFARTGAHGCPVLDGDRLVGMVARSDLARAEEGPPGRGRTKDPLTAGDICTRDPATVVAHDPVSRGVRRMAALDVGRLPVVSPEDHHHLVGLLRRSDLVSAYQQAVERTVSAQLRRHAAPVRDLVGIDFLEAMIDAGSAAGGRLIREIDWPGRSVVTSIRRDGQVILPHGETRLQAGDEVTVLAPLDASERLRELFGADAEG